jgi:hypothetical protein
MDEDEGDRYREIATLKISDREYQLVHRLCEDCGNRHYRVYRFCGIAFACYRLHDGFDPANFEEFVHRVDDELMQSSADMLADFKQDFHQSNSPDGIDADFSRKFLVMEYARHRLSKLQKMGLLKSLESSAKPRTKLQTAVRLGFELGAAVNEHNVMKIFEDYLWDGMAVAEWRNTGLPRAREERIRQGLRSRKAILAAANLLYVKNPKFLRNDTETARAIQKMNVPELRQENGSSLGIDAITKHLRAARKEHTISGST